MTFCPDQNIASSANRSMAATNDAHSQQAGALIEERRSRSDSTIPSPPNLLSTPPARELSAVSTGLPQVDAADCPEPDSEAAPEDESHRPRQARKKHSSQLSSLDKALSKDTIYWDEEHAGVGRRVRNGRSTTWIVQFRYDGGSVRRTLGNTDEMDRGQAAAAAQKLREEFVALPRPPSHGLSSPITLRQFSKQFLLDRRSQWKRATIQSNDSQVARLVAGSIGDFAVKDITKNTVSEWWAGSATQCNRTLSLLSQMLRHAEHVGLRRHQSNPCRHMTRKRTEFRANYPQAVDYSLIGAGLRHLQPEFPHEVALLKFTAYSGTRRGQALGLKWNQIEGDKAILHDSKTGPCSIWLTNPAKQILDAQKLRAPPPKPTDYVFGNGCRGVFDRRVSVVWKRVCNRSRLRQMRVHDLRHGFASVAVGAGIDLRVVGALLGHRDPNTTQGYAHLAEQDVAAAAERVSKKLDQNLKPSRR